MTPVEARALTSLVDVGTTPLLINVAEDITQRMRNSSPGVFRGWLEDTVEKIVVPTSEPMPPLLAALKDMPALLATLNYDNLLEAVTGYKPVTWDQPHQVQKVLTGQAPNSVVHLHGHYETPDSVVLGQLSYAKVKHDAHASTVLKSFAIKHTLLFVGCGDTILDPNFTYLIEWGKDALANVAPRHYLLCRNVDVAAFQEKLREAPWLQPLSYGDTYDELAPFLRSLYGGAAGTVAPPDLPPVPAAPALVPVLDDAIARGHFGLDEILDTCTSQLRKTPLLALYGLTGVGKSVIVKELRRLPAWRALRVYTHIVQAQGGLDDIFAALAPILDIHDERPRCPVANTAQNMMIELLALRPHVPAFFLHIERGHLWFEHGKWRPAFSKVADLLNAMVKAYPGSVIVLETREEPTDMTAIEASGLVKAGMKQYLAHPSAGGVGWTLNKTQADYIFQRMGGGHGRGAHAFGLTLLAQLAAAKGSTPEQILRHYADDYSTELYTKLFRDIYENILAPSERELLYACSLYRRGLHYSHLSRLESTLPSPSAGEVLIRRRLLTEDEEWFYLHDLAAEQAHKLAPSVARTLTLQQHIADFWLTDLKGQNMLLEPNIRRALEGLYHLEQAGEGHRVTEIAAELLGRRPDEAAALLWSIEEAFNRKNDSKRVCMVLEYLLQVVPTDTKAMRFLGEARRKLYGKTDARALMLFRDAVRYSPNYPHYWANYGHAAIACGAEALCSFLEDIANAPPSAINDQVATVYASALQATGSVEAASTLRQEKIAAGSNSPFFYADEAKWLLDEQHDPEGALAVLELAHKHGCADDVTEAIRSTALQATGHVEAASKLRQEKIAAGSRHAAFYNDEAKWLLDGQHNSKDALAVLELAHKHGAADDVTEAIRSSALQATGHVEAASMLRQEKIAAGSRHATFYNDEAKWLLDGRYDPEGALAVLELARKRGSVDDVTEAIRTSVLRAKRESDNVK
jgi:hypothetical protein